ncbi:uncharacterized protein LOC132627253 [Lycium barbarum]|uniref:uncharacterized protein LOC132627253 n=1 Tax=Lycium barbarum TaxID=112863 RepID=UPI00293E18C4|nr:uncharacterized protein LOC132627253 [Lycium barbarum]
MSWRRLTYNNSRSPKWLFLVTLATQGRLYTKDKLFKWGITEDLNWPLCMQAEETVDHLFFSCHVAAQLWKDFLVWQGINRDPVEWKEEVLWMLNYCRNKNVIATTYKMFLAAAVYFAWQERNKIVFQKTRRQPELILAE